MTFGKSGAELLDDDISIYEFHNFDVLGGKISILLVKNCL